MNSLPLLSIIIPVYNVSQYINQCIDSVLMSTYTNLEIILIDDGSTDDSGRICDEYAKSDERISVIHQENAGLSAARNAGLSKMHGDFVAFLDSDDWIEPSCYEKSIHMILENDLSCVHYNTRMVSFDGKKTILKLCMSDRKCIVDRDCMISLLLSGKRKYQFAWNAVYDAKLWNQIRFPLGRNWEDVATKYLAIFKAEKKIGFLPDYLINYRYNPNGISFSKSTIDSSYQLFLAYKERYEFALLSYPNLSKRCLSNAYAIAQIISNNKVEDNRILDKKDELKQSECRNFVLKNRKNVALSPKTLYGVLRFYYEIYYFLFRTSRAD